MRHHSVRNPLVHLNNTGSKREQSDNLTVYSMNPVNIKQPCLKEIKDERE